MWKAKFFVPVIAVLLFAGTVAPAQAASLSEDQIQSILGLLSSFGADTSVIGNVSASLRGQATSVASAPVSSSSVCSYVSGLSQTLYEGISDGATGGQVTMLQKFLAADSSIYPEGSITGYFGPATERAVQRWQVQNGVVSSGSPETNGYGVVGSMTRAAFAKRCGNTSSPSYTTPMPTKPLPTTPTTNPKTNTWPSITFSYISSGNVIGSYANLPANSQIRLVNSSTGQAYTAQNTLVWSGGSGSLSIPIPNDLPNGSYYLRVTDYYSPSTTILESKAFQTGSDVQTQSVTISQFSASPTTVSAGQAILFTWSSNLSQNDISVYGGGCNIEGVTQNNVALNVTSGFVGASGSVTYVAPATAKYTLLCSSGGKDGSSSASAQATVYVGQQQTNSVVINSFTASQTSVSSGQPIVLSWSSNLTDNDISYYGGGCDISALTSSNQQIHLTSGSTSGASGSISYTPALTATYTLTCSAGAKDGSPMNTKQVTVYLESSIRGVTAVGVYEGSYPSGVQHSYNFHPEGTVNVKVTGDTGQSRDLVLTSYEPVNWVLSVPSNVIISKIIVTGYHKSRVTNVPSGTQVEYHSYDTDGQYYYAYQSSGESFNQIKQWLTGLYRASDGELYGNFVFPGYSASSVEVYVGYKG
ncbi:MAG: peptidoglycan-binding domain-containing protein [Patescibacteria group bacterium]